MHFHCVDPEFVTSRCLIIHPSPIATKHLCIHASSSWTKPERRSSQWIWWDVPGAQSSLCCHVSMCIRCTAPNEQHWFYCASGCQLPTWTAKRRMDFCPPTGRSSKSSCETTLQCPHGYPQLMGYMGSQLQHEELIRQLSPLPTWHLSISVHGFSVKKKVVFLVCFRDVSQHCLLQLA